MMMRFWFVFIFMFLPAICWGQIIVKKTGGGAAFPLVSSHETVIYYDARDYGVVEKTACLLAEDIKRVTDKKVSVSSKKVRNMPLLWERWDIMLLLTDWWQRGYWMYLPFVVVGNSLSLKR